MSFSPFLGSQPEDRFKVGVEDAHKRGVNSPAGVFSLLGELDYYRLLETLIRGPITDQQLVTPFRWWLFFKGSALASLIGTLLLLLRITLLIPGPNVSFDFKYAVYLTVYTTLIYRIALIFSNYLRYPDGVTWTAAQATLQGYTAGILSSEMLKVLFFFATHASQTLILQHVYGKYQVVDVLADYYFSRFLGPSYSEIVELILCGLAVYYGTTRFNLLTEELRVVQDEGRPYDLVKG